MKQIYFKKGIVLYTPVYNNETKENESVATLIKRIEQLNGRFYFCDGWNMYTKKEIIEYNLDKKKIINDYIKMFKDIEDHKWKEI